MTTQNLFMQRAETLVPVFAERANAMEAARQVLPATIADIKAAGFHRMSQPKRFGGAEQPLNETVDIISKIARGCASSAWVAGLYNDHSIILSKFDPRAIDEVWGPNRDALISASFFPAGTNERVAGGWKITGTWSWASGCDYADWLLLGSMCQFGDGPPVPTLCLVPRSELTIDDNWHVMGLVGTGSKNIVGKSVFVPEHRALPIPFSNQGIPPGREGLAPLHRIPHVSNVPFLFIAAALGVAESLLDMTIEYVSKRSTPLVKLAELQSMQLHVAEAAADIDCARLLVMRDLTESMMAMVEGRTLTLQQRARNRRDQAYVGRLCRRSVDRLFASAGSQGIFNSNMAQRKFRDMCAISTHISLSWDMGGTTFGRVAFGLDPATLLV